MSLRQIAIQDKTNTADAKKHAQELWMGIENAQYDVSISYEMANTYIQLSNPELWRLFITVFNDVVEQMVQDGKINEKTAEKIRTDPIYQSNLFNAAIFLLLLPKNAFGEISALSIKQSKTKGDLKKTSKRIFEILEERYISENAIEFARDHSSHLLYGFEDPISATILSYFYGTLANIAKGKPVKIHGQEINALPVDNKDIPSDGMGRLLNRLLRLYTLSDYYSKSGSYSFKRLHEYDKLNPLQALVIADFYNDRETLNTLMKAPATFAYLINKTRLSLDADANTQHRFQNLVENMTARLYPTTNEKLKKDAEKHIADMVSFLVLLLRLSSSLGTAYLKALINSGYTKNPYLTENDAIEIIKIAYSDQSVINDCIKAIQTDLSFEDYQILGSTSFLAELMAPYIVEPLVKRAYLSPDDFYVDAGILRPFQWMFGNAIYTVDYLSLYIGDRELYNDLNIPWYRVAMRAVMGAVEIAGALSMAGAIWKSGARAAASAKAAGASVAKEVTTKNAVRIGVGGVLISLGLYVHHKSKEEYKDPLVVEFSTALGEVMIIAGAGLALYGIGGLLSKSSGGAIAANAGKVSTRQTLKDAAKAYWTGQKTIIGGAAKTTASVITSANRLFNWPARGFGWTLRAAGTIIKKGGAPQFGGFLADVGALPAKWDAVLASGEIEKIFAALFWGARVSYTVPISHFVSGEINHHAPTVSRLPREYGQRAVNSYWKYLYEKSSEIWKHMKAGSMPPLKDMLVTFLAGDFAVIGATATLALAMVDPLAVEEAISYRGRPPDRWPAVEKAREQAMKQFLEDLKKAEIEEELDTQTD